MAAATKENVENHTWLREALPKHERLSTAVESLLENMLKKKGIEYLGVTCRTKTLDGAIEKIGRKSYENPAEQLTDLSGIRVITYLEEQVDKISLVIKQLFEIDAKNSRDRAEILGDDRVGYRSTHYVCRLGKPRDDLPEYESLGNLKFEIQVRTVLQHAWAELAHDRSFKFGATLPPKIQRKLNLYSGMLEIVDGAFDEVSKEIDAYSRSLKNKSLEQIADIGIDSISIAKYFSDVAKRGVETRSSGGETEPIIELNRLGIKTIGQLEKLTTGQFLTAHKKISTVTTTAGFLRTLMMYSDLQKYLESKPGWSELPSIVFNILAEKYDKDLLAKILSEAKIKVANVPVPDTQS